MENVPREAMTVGENNARLDQISAYLSDNEETRDSRVKRLPGTNVHDHQAVHLPIAKGSLDDTPVEFCFARDDLILLQSSEDELPFQRSEEARLVGPIVHHPE